MDDIFFRRLRTKKCEPHHNHQDSISIDCRGFRLSLLMDILRCFHSQIFLIFSSKHQEIAAVIVDIQSHT